MSWQVRRTDAGLWELLAPSGQVAGFTTTREEAVETVKLLGRVQDLARRGVAAVEVPTMTETMRAQLDVTRRERARKDQGRRAYTGRVSAPARRRDPALDRWLTERKRRNAA